MARNSAMTTLLREARLSRPADRQSPTVVAAELAVSTRTYSDWERGAYVPPLHHWTTIRDVLGVELSDLNDAAEKLRRTIKRRSNAAKGVGLVVLALAELALDMMGWF